MPPAGTVDGSNARDGSPGTISASWAGLHRLRGSFGARRTRVDERALFDLARGLGATAVPLCLRELGGPADRRLWAVELLRVIAEVAGDRVRAGLRAVTDQPAVGAPAAAAGAINDDAKLIVLALLAELGDDTATARFADPARMHRQSLARFATQLDTPADVASAADLLIERLSPGEILEFVEAFSEASADGARRLSAELCARVDLDVAARGELARLTSPLHLSRAPSRTGPPERAPRRPLARPALLVGMRHADGRTVVAIVRRAPRAAGEPPAGWRALCVLCDPTGTITSVLYRDDAGLRTVRDEVLAPLEADGYQRFAMSAAAARRLVGAAARRSVSLGRALPSAYYLGRDLLGLDDAHVVGARATGPAALLGRAVDLLAAGDSARARPLLEHVVAMSPDDAEAASSLGLCLLAQGDVAAALAQLERAAWLEPAWPLHHWNVAAAAHRAGELARCARALRDFLVRADDPVATSVDPGHARRVTLARRFVADHARLVGTDRAPGDHDGGGLSS